jgi:hypothetical protein
MTCTKLKQESENERKQSPQTQHSLDKWIRKTSSKLNAKGVIRSRKSKKTDNAMANNDNNIYDIQHIIQSACTKYRATSTPL